ncbi:MAG: hypothetical protein GY737_14490 [Desulfobacteraceae bacterium]|nr:hypothetical protein [Desulfobacteraceae bacterium]
MDTTNIKTDTPMTLATIEAFRKMLDVMEEFVRNTEAERLAEERAGG